MNINNKILKNALNSKDLPNLLIYPGCGEKIFYEYLNEIYKIVNIQRIEMGEISYIKTSNYYEFNLKYIISKNINNLIEIIKSIIISKNFYSDNNKIIIFKNFNKVRISLQNILRVIIEKYRETSVFIFLTDNYSNIIQPLKSRFLCLRFAGETNKDKREIIYNNTDKKLKTHKYYDFMYSLETENINKIVLKENEIEKYINPYDKISLEILKIYDKKNELTKLRNIAYNILKNNINVNKFYKNLLENLIINKKIRDNSKYKIIRILADSNHDFAISYRNIIILESLLINIYYTIKDDLHAYPPEPHGEFCMSS